MIFLALALSLAGCSKGPGKTDAAASVDAKASLLIAPQDLVAVQSNALSSGPSITGSVQPQRRADLRDAASEGTREIGPAVASTTFSIIGGTITSTLLTLLVVPTFYDSIEITRDRAIAKFHARAALRNSLVAFVLTLLEALAALVMLRWLYRTLTTAAARIGPRVKR